MLPLVSRGWWEMLRVVVKYLLLTPAFYQVLSPLPNRTSSRGRQLEGCPVIGSPGILMKYSRGSHLLDNKMQSRKKESGCWCVLATRQSQGSIVSAIANASVCMRPGWEPFLYFLCQFTCSAAPLQPSVPTIVSSNQFTAQTREKLPNMTDSNTITLISHRPNPQGWWHWRVGLLFNPLLLRLPNKNQCWISLQEGTAMPTTQDMFSLSTMMDGILYI